jgi:hypothetical protein
MIRKNGFTFGPEAMAGNIGKFPRTREGKKADQMTKVRMQLASYRKNGTPKPISLPKEPWAKNSED